MRPDLRVGIRVVLSDKAKARGIEDTAKPGRRGRILAARPPLAWVVLWDGRKTSSTYHEDFLRAVNQPRSSAAPAGGA